MSYQLEIPLFTIAQMVDKATRAIKTTGIYTITILEWK
jgi:hypothetical protein